MTRGPSLAAEPRPANRGGRPREGGRSVALEGGFRAVIAEDSILGGAGTGLVPTCSLDAWVAFLNALTEGRALSSESRVLKSSPDIEVVQTTIVDGPSRLGVVSKRYCDARRRGWRRWFSTSLAEGDFRVLKKLRECGVTVPRPMAFVGGKSSSRYSWVVTEFVDGLVELEQIALTLLPQLPLSKRRKIKAAITVPVVELLNSFDRAKLHHRDLKASNILIRHWDGSDGVPESWIVDVEGFRGGKLFAESKRRQRLVRLAASLREYASIARTDHARFLRAYGRAAYWERDQWRTYFRTLSKEASQYARRSVSRKKHKIDGYGG